MATIRTKDFRDDQVARLVQQAMNRLGSDVSPELAETVYRRIEQYMAQNAGTEVSPTPTDGGLADLLGLGSDTPISISDAPAPRDIGEYDNQVTSQNIVATAELYYICLHERMGMFRVMEKLSELFEAGTLRISAGDGAGGLYRYKKHNILRYSMKDRWQAYKRLFGYTTISPGANARSNDEFHGLFTHFIGEAAKFWRDKRISEVIRHNATDPTFGSMAIVRRAALDLRNNLKNSSYGNIHVMRIEAGQMLNEAFRILQSSDIREQFGAESGWDVLELVMWQYFHESVNASAINRMAVSGREILRWLAQSHILQGDRTQFEALLMQIAEYAEEWISSEEGMRLSRPTPPPRNVYVPGAPPVGVRRDPIIRG